MATHTHIVKEALSALLIINYFLVSLVYIFMPENAGACAVCFVAKRETLMAYLGTGVMLSILPFVLVGGFAWWLQRQMQSYERRSVAAERRDRAREVV
ncbi:MAG TPA: hypothetical protein VNN62_24765 [Methylomirabilota bacterium]|jgi:hypothetical protein|nr:hypothetical protein [Methylomirabilota bacterium]